MATPTSQLTTLRRQVLSDPCSRARQTKLCKVYLIPKLSSLPITRLAGGVHKRGLTLTLLLPPPCFCTHSPLLLAHLPSSIQAPLSLRPALPGSLLKTDSQTSNAHPPGSGCLVSRHHFRRCCHEALTQTLAHFITSPGYLIFTGMTCSHALQGHGGDGKTKSTELQLPTLMPTWVPP